MVGYHWYGYSPAATVPVYAEVCRFATVSTLPYATGATLLLGAVNGVQHKMAHGYSHQERIPEPLTTSTCDALTAMLASSAREAEGAWQ